MRQVVGSRSVMASLLDQLQRPLRDLRISVTDRCNFRCPYCMPRSVYGPGFRFLPREEILSYEEIARLAEIFARLGVRKIRISGGEPLLRQDLPDLVRLLKQRTGLEVALTTNGSLLARYAKSLAEAGLDRVTVSLDSLDEEIFQEMNDADFPVSDVLEGIAAAAVAGLSPVKVNAVVQKGVNDHTLLDLVRHFHGSGHVLRFIEFMDVGNSNRWKLDQVLPGTELIERIADEFPLEAIESSYRGEVARRWRFSDGGGEIGFVTSVSNPFCSDCTRARISAAGKLYTCLFATQGVDLKAALRDRSHPENVEALIRETWAARTDRYSERRTENTEPGSKIEMSYIGG